jgi:drug/metabolite transporter (DMT)-like permease
MRATDAAANRGNFIFAKYIKRPRFTSTNLDGAVRAKLFSLCVEGADDGLWAEMERKPHDGALAGSLLLAVFLFGANNTGIKFMVGFWPPLAIGASRFLLAGLILLALLHWTPIFGTPHALTPKLKRHLWWRTGLLMALYIVVFNYAMKLTLISHVALYLGAAPVWALLWEGQPEKHWRSAQRYGAAALAFCGVLVLFLPTLWHLGSGLLGEILGLACSVLWTNFGRQCRSLGSELSAMEISAHTFWRAGLLLAPFSLVELAGHKITWRTDLALVQLFCVVGGSVVAFALWNHGLRHWRTSQVYLFNNFIPLSNMAWANVCLGETITGRFWVSMLLICAGVILGQANWQRVFGGRWMPSD